MLVPVHHTLVRAKLSSQIGCVHPLQASGCSPSFLHYCPQKRAATLFLRCSADRLQPTDDLQTATLEPLTVAYEAAASSTGTESQDNGSGAAPGVVDELEKLFPKPKFDLMEDTLATNEAIVMQGFGWTSCEHKGTWYSTVTAKVPEMAAAGFTHIWLPPPSHSVSKQGYLPDELYDLDTPYGSKEDIILLNQTLRSAQIRPVADIVINHRSAAQQGPDGKWNQYTDRVPHPGLKVDWGAWAITGNDPDFGGQGAADTGDDYNPAPDIDHANELIRRGIKDWMVWLKDWVGFMSWRFDFVRGYAPRFISEYITDTVGAGRYCVGENWVNMRWDGSYMSYHQDEARQQMCDWINATGKTCGLFDFPTKGILQEAVKNCEYDRLRDSNNKPPGLIGWWPSKATTFVDNHDTGGVQNHWPFPKSHMDLGYAYILTHPGKPCVLFEHFFYDGLGKVIAELMAVRRRAGIVADSPINIWCAEKDMYVACINDRVVIKLGPRYDMGSHLPNAHDGWKFGLSGKDWALWEKA